MRETFTALSADPNAIASAVLDTHRRVLILGEPGTNKRALLGEMARVMHPRERIWCVDADTGLPAFGPPGAVSLGEWREDDWHVAEVRPLCSLDAARFRLPLVQAVTKLVRSSASGVLLINAPGIVVGMAAAELATSLVEAVDAVVVLHKPGAAIPLADELGACGREVFTAQASPDARGANAGARAKARTRAWDRYLEQGKSCTTMLSGLRRLGAPPPVDAIAAWVGRQVAFGRGERWIGFGEILAVDADALGVRIVGDVGGADRLLVRDAARGANKELRTALPVARLATIRKHATRAQTEVRCGPVIANLVNGVTGDPLLMVRLRYRRGALLFDVGESNGLSRRLLHTVTDVFLSHAHLDHVAGFPYLLRSRLSARLPALRVYGPAGTRDHIAGFLAGVRWDRVGEGGPEFEITELDGDYIVKSREKAGCPNVSPVERHAYDGRLLKTPDLTVRALELDHGIPVIAYALQMSEQHNVDAGLLAARGLAPGPWIGDLKANVQRGAIDAPVRLPDGTRVATGTLAEDLLRTTIGPKIVYATDFADHAANRRKVTAFAKDAQLLFCEATFRVDDHALASRAQHLTTRACGEIARASRADRLVPFHFSKRYEGNLAPVYDEIRAVSGGVSVVEHAAAQHPVI